MTDDEMEQLLQEVTPTIRTFAWSYFKDGEQVADAIQAHALYLWAHRRDIALDRNPRAYAISAAHNTFWGIIRRKRLESTMHDFNLDQDAPYTARGDERSEIQRLEVRRALAGLPRQLKLASWLVWGEGYTEQEAADKLGVVRMTLQRWLIKARAQLRAKLLGRG